MRGGLPHVINGTNAIKPFMPLISPHVINGTNAINAVNAINGNRYLRRKYGLYVNVS